MGTRVGTKNKVKNVTFLPHSKKNRCGSKKRNGVSRFLTAVLKFEGYEKQKRIKTCAGIELQLVLKSKLIHTPRICKNSNITQTQESTHSMQIDEYQALDLKDIVKDNT